MFALFVIYVNLCVRTGETVWLVPTVLVRLAFIDSHQILVIKIDGIWFTGPEKLDCFQLRQEPVWELLGILLAQSSTHLLVFSSVSEFQTQNTTLDTCLNHTSLFPEACRLDSRKTLQGNFWAATKWWGPSATEYATYLCLICTASMASFQTSGFGSTGSPAY